MLFVRTHKQAMYRLSEPLFSVVLSSVMGGSIGVLLQKMDSNKGKCFKFIKAH